mgnify:FL=1
MTPMTEPTDPTDPTSQAPQAPQAAARLAGTLRGLTNHTPSAEQVERIENLRLHAKRFAEAIYANTTHSRDQLLAVTALEVATMRAVRSIVLEEPATPQDLTPQD